MNSAHIQPSFPPPDEEDTSHANHWQEGSPSEGSPFGSRGDKGKGKESDEEGVDNGEAYAGADEYPPTKEEEEESRRIEENLRKWETAERERRKAARESGASGSRSSIVTDITRRASLLWPGSRAKQASLGGVGAHRKLRTTDLDSVPLDDIDASPGPSRAVTPEPLDNPFTTPSQSTVDLALAAQPAIMTASGSQSPFEDAERSPTTPTALAGPALVASSSISKEAPPPPQPLNLPRPRTPPPRAETPHATRPPEPVPPLAVVPHTEQEQERQVRWWTEWLCGCSEGPDRGGDHQAGRTNPFE